MNENEMRFMIAAGNGTEQINFGPAAVTATFDKVLQLQQDQFENILVTDSDGRTINLDELCALYTASEDSNEASLQLTPDT